MGFEDLNSVYFRLISTLKVELVSRLSKSLNVSVYKNKQVSLVYGREIRILKVSKIV